MSMTDKKVINLLSQMFLPCFDDDEKAALTFAINAIQDNTLKQAEIDELIHKLECLLCHATNGKLSYHTYSVATMETHITDAFNESYNDGYNDGITEFWRSLKEQAYIPNLSLTGEYVIDVSDGENIVKEMVGEQYD